MKSYLTIDETVEMMEYVCRNIIESKPLLTEIDSAIGDGDHGIGMEIGCNAALIKLNKQEFKTINEIFIEIGRTMIMTMGGASGVIFGTLFLSGFNKQKDVTELDLKTLTNAFSASLKVIMKRGKAKPGDKTMVDALAPAVHGLQRSIETKKNLLEGLEFAMFESAAGVEKTKELLGRVGRSKTLGKRAIGNQDAGATSVWIIFKSMYEWNKEKFN